MRRQLVASLSSLLGTTCCGMTAAFPSTLLPQIHLYVNADMGSWLTSINIFSQFIGIIVGSLLMRKFGRKPCLILVNIPWLIGWICLSFANNFWILLMGCSIVGTASGIYGNLAAIYLVEMPEPHFRGFFAALNTVCFAFGIFLQNLIGILFWRTALHVSTVLPLLTFLVAFYAPESPNWLILNERPDEAKENFFWLRSVNDDNEDEFTELLNSNSEDESHIHRRIMDHILSKQFVRSFFVVFLSMAVDVVSGFDSVTMYSVDMIGDMSKELSAKWVAVLINGFAVISGAISCTFFEKIPRRVLFFVSSIGVLLSICAVVSVLTFSLSKWFLVVFLCVYEAAGNIGMLTIPWLLAGEVFSDATRELGSGLSNMCYFILALAAVKMNPFMIQTLGIEMLFVIYASLTSICLLILYFVMPETQGCTLQQIQNRLNGHE